MLGMLTTLPLESFLCLACEGLYPGLLLVALQLLLVVFGGGCGLALNLWSLALKRFLSRPRNQ